MRLLAVTLLSALLAGLSLPGGLAAASRLAPAGAAAAGCQMTCCKRHAPQAACARGWNCGRPAHSAVAPPPASLPAAPAAVTAPLYSERAAQNAALPGPQPPRDLPERPPRS